MYQNIKCNKKQKKNKNINVYKKVYPFPVNTIIVHKKTDTKKHSSGRIDQH